MNEIIKLLNTIHKFKNPIKGYYNKEKDRYSQRVMIFYEKDSDHSYLVNIHPIYVLDLNAMDPSPHSLIQMRLTDDIKTLLRNSLNS